MSHHIPKDDDVPPSIPPPSYQEALNSPPVMPDRPPQEQANSHLPQHFQSNSGPAMNVPHVPPQPPRPEHGPTPPARPPAHGSSLIYTNNPHLPFEFPPGYFCNKCKNTGFKEKNKKACSQCWPKFFKNKAYNPNPELNFRYPKGFICDRCHNTGIKLKNGLTCKDCYARFAPRNSVSQAPIRYTQPLFSSPFSLYGGPGGPGFGPPATGPGGFGAPMAPQCFQPGDPRMGGTLCGRCRGSGMVTFFLDRELCLLCGGVGRLFNTLQSAYRG